MTNRSPPTHLSVPLDGLLVFIDETGHERMPGGHVVYGVGACAVMMRDYDRLVVQPWRALRQLVLGNPNAPIHAYEFGLSATRAQLEAVARVFQDNAFMRLGSGVSLKTEMPKDETYKQAMTSVPEEEYGAWMVLRSFYNRILDVARWTDFRSVTLIFESNPRSKALRQKALADLKIEENGATLPLDIYEMEKSVGEPGSEVADFVANAVHGHAKAALADGRRGFRKDFQAVFHGVDPKITSFMGITTVAWTPASPTSAK
jgi:hypothetical protein